MDRRSFNTSMIAAAAGAVMPIHLDYSRRLVLPKRLQTGDLIGLIAPAGLMSEERIARCREKIKSYGFRILEGKHLTSSYGYLAGTDDERLSDLHEMYSRKDVKGIWCARGGYGITRILDKINYKLIRKNPKVLIGFSDITALLNTIYQRTGILGFHGPLGSSVDNTFSREILRDLTMHPEKEVEILPHYPVDTNYDELYTIVSGTASGQAIGGNLSLIAALIGTPYEIKCKDKILFIEDVGEEPYRIDRMLTQLLNSDSIKGVKGFALGQFKGCNPSNPDRSLSLKSCLIDRLKPMGVPAIYGLNFGHVDHNFTFPIGGEVKVNCDTGKVEILGQVVG